MASMHRKEEVVGPVMCETVGLRLVTAPDLDTDQLGTFCGEIPRQGTMLEVAVRKARLGMRSSCLPLGLASEGTFGPHPGVPFFSAGMELMVLVDDERNLIIHESLITETNFSHLVVSPDESVISFLDHVGFPQHALIAQPNVTTQLSNPVKGITRIDDLAQAIHATAAMSPDGRTKLTTDMRAHLNPTRMRSLHDLSVRLAKRLAKSCPDCGVPGFGRTGTEAGLTCEECGAITDMVRTEIFRCQVCDYQELRPRSDGLSRAPALYCPECNP